MFATKEELLGSATDVGAAPRDSGTVELIVCRPAKNERQELDEGQLDLALGLVGDNWAAREQARNKGKAIVPDTQLNLMNARAIAAIAKERTRWSLAGDQFYVDFDLSYANVPPGTQLALGEAIIEVTAEPHLGCAKFRDRFGAEAVAFVNSPVGKALNARGICAKVVKAGKVKRGATIRKNEA
jgi:MOSC domain-containing protein YiiM